MQRGGAGRGEARGRSRWVVQVQVAKKKAWIGSSHESSTGRGAAPTPPPPPRRPLSPLSRGATAGWPPAVAASRPPSRRPGYFDPVGSSWHRPDESSPLFPRLGMEEGFQGRVRAGLHLLPRLAPALPGVARLHFATSNGGCRETTRRTRCCGEAAPNVPSHAPSPAAAAAIPLTHHPVDT